MFARIAVCLAVFPMAVSAEEWNQWRGPNRDGLASVFPTVKAWPQKLNLKWKVNIGEGHASPVVSGGRVYLHSRQGEREVVSCLRLETGQAIWQQGYPAPYRVISIAASHGNGVKSTPVVQGGRIYTFGISGILSCLDAQTGKLQWRKEFAAPLYGTAMSPMVDGSLLIAHVAARRGGALTAFDTETGNEKWSWKGDGPAYASPIVAELAGTRQIVTQSRTRIIGVSAATGELLWQIPYTTAYDQNAVSPALYRDLLIFSGLRNGVIGVKVSRRGSAFAAETVWHNDEVSMYMSSPVVSGGLVYGLSNRNSGQFFCLDPRTGATLWTSAGRQGENAAIIGAGSSLFLLTTNGELIVANRSARAFEPLRRYGVADSPTWAHPAILTNGFLIKDATTLALWELP